jgi:hypothetical protein
LDFSKEITQPYLQFLQASCIAKVDFVRVKIGSSSISMEAYSTQGCSSPETFCKPATVGEPGTDVLGDAAQILSRVGSEDLVLWALERASEKTVEGYQLEQSTYTDIPSQLAQSLVPKRARGRKEEYRLILVHDWKGEGGFLGRVWSNLKRRSEILSVLKEAARFYPVPLLLDAKVGQTPVLEDAVLRRKTYRPSLSSVIYSHRPAILYYQATAADDPQRFISEPLSDWYDVVLTNDGSETHELPGRVSISTKQHRVHVLIIEPLDQGGVVTQIPRVGNPQAQGAEMNLELFPEQMEVDFYSNNRHFTVKGQAFYSREAILIPQKAEGDGWIYVAHRGLVIEAVSVDLGIPGAVVVKGIDVLNVDDQGAIVKDAEWESFVLEAREKLSLILRNGAPHITQDMVSYPFVQENLRNQS